MISTGLLLELVLLLGVTAAGLALFERLRLPAIAGFLVAGAVAGPGALGLVADPDRVRTLAEIGVIFLLFEIGLELPVERMRELGRAALLAGAAQVAATTALVTLGAAAIGVAPATAFVIGAMVAMSSTALVMRLLADDAQLDTPHGQLAVAVLIFQDLAVVPFLLVVPLLAAGAEFGTRELVYSIGRMLAALVFVAGVVRFGVPRVLNRVAAARSPDLFSLLALLIVVGSAFLAEELGLTLAVGAFLAGVAATTSPYAQQLFSEVVPLRGVILGVFFTAVGMLFDPSVLVAHAPQVLLYLLTTTLLKAAIITAASLLLAGRSVRIAVLAGLVLAQTGEFSFVLAEAAFRAGLFDREIHQIVLAGSILSLLASPFLIRAAPRLADAAALWFERGEREAIAPELGQAAPDAARVIVIGYGRAGQTLTRILRAIEAPCLVIDANARAVQQALVHSIPIVFGDATRPTVLARLGVETARLVVLAISDPLATHRIISRLRLIAPDTPVLARTRRVAEVDGLEAAGASSVVAEEFEGSIELVARTLERFHIPTGAIARFTDALREEGYGAIRTPVTMPVDPWLVELLEETGTEWTRVPVTLPDEVTIGSLGIRKRTGASVVAVERGGRTVTNPGPEFALRAGDRLLVLGDADSLARLDQLLAEA